MDKIYFGYARVSTIEQNLERQFVELKLFAERNNITFRHIYSEKTSGVQPRLQLNELLKYARKDDVIVVESYSRISRNLKDLLDIIDLLNKNQVTLISIKEGLNTSTAQGTFILNIMGSISQLERDLLRERQKEGIAIAKLQGKYKGRVRIQKPPNFEECLKRYLASNRLERYPFRQFMKDTNLKGGTLRKFIQKYKNTISLNQLGKIEEKKISKS